ncbi:MAG TPA: patatin family protein [Verrucomicrobia bacterium]|nr:patatin family protein [Verrucomicrobiota bacterium]
MRCEAGVTTTFPMRGDAALVLEGGGMRAQYASGAMDFFLKEGLRFPYVIGVSAGISNAASYVSGQFERNRRIYTTFAGDPRYFSWRNWLRQGNPFGMDFIYRELPKYLPFDFAAFEASPTRFRIGATDCETGRAIFFDKADAPLTEALLASSSLPMVGRMARVNGKLYLDGGISDPIPFRQAGADGFPRRVVVLTRNRGFRKPKPRAAHRAAIRWKYRHFPPLAEAVVRQAETYNREMDELEAEEAAGQVLVIRPSQPLAVGRYSQDREELERLYQNGWADAEAGAPQLHDFLSP